MIDHWLKNLVLSGESRDNAILRGAFPDEMARGRAKGKDGGELHLGGLHERTGMRYGFRNLRLQCDERGPQRTDFDGGSSRATSIPMACARACTQ